MANLVTMAIWRGHSDKVSIYAMEGSMIGIECQLVIYRGHIRLPKNIF